MFTSSASSGPPSELELKIDGQPEEISLIGPSFHGWIYRSMARPHFYRIIPIDAAPLQRRDDVRKWIEKQTPDNVARITKAWHDGGYFYIRYEIEGPADVLAGALTQADPSVRIQYAVLALRALPGWWKSLYSPLLPMPADIAYTNAGQPRLLAIPRWGLPDIDSVLEEPARAMYLPPEFVCGRSTINWESVDRYGMGVSLLQCFYKMPAVTDAGSILLLAANGTLFLNLESDLPFWMKDLVAARRAVSAARTMVTADADGRSAVDPENVASVLENSRRRMNPLTAATEMRDHGQPFEAFTLLQNVMVTEETFELLLLAGEIAGQQLDRPLEAADLLERAIAKEPHRIDAYISQFEILANASELAPLSDLVRNNKTAAEQTDARVRRDFQNMPGDSQQEHEVDMAYFLLWRGQFDSVLEFIYPRIVHGETHLWWKFDLNLAYTRALMANSRLDAAQAQLNNIKAGLSKANQNRTVAEDEIRRYGEEVADLEARLFELKRALPGART